MLQLTWGWQPALYLFLGGMGAGAFIMAAVLYLLDSTKHRLVVCASMYAAFASLAIGLLLLLAELISPARGLMMWASFSHFTSWMTYGAWGAFLAMIVFIVSALLATKQVGNWLNEKWKWYTPENSLKLRRGLAWAGIVLGAFVAVYTGMLLMSAGGVPLWNTLLLPLLFTVSAFDTGVALVEIIAVLLHKKDPLAEKAAALMERIVIALVVIELLVIAVFLGSMFAGGSAAAESAGMLVSGGLAAPFWIMIIVLGLALPLVMALACMLLKKKDANKDARPMMVIGAAGALIGGCELRFLILAAGIHAAVVSETIMGLLL
ncbi:MAG: polysulfide reductase NrfD [Eggerthellaceae bacterium]|nr:polysulfide reductase NrfD [Eggerthellaceae bacterium]